MPAEGEFTLQRQKNGRGYYGNVTVRVRSGAGSGEPPVVWSVPEDDRTSIQPRTDAEYVDAAIAGAGDGMELARDCGREVDGLLVEIVHAQVQLTDIEESAMRAAAAMAVTGALGLRDEVELGFDAGWVVHRRAG
ncbi:hypothetical protein [Amycolatopsis antarctica]|nr:hypothetical protein [Amycolatopsis antarctica]